MVMNADTNPSTMPGRILFIFQRLSFNQKVTIIVATLAMALVLTFVIRWASAPDMVPLFSNLPAADAGKITQWLEEENIEYSLEQGGSRILVPRANQYQARIELAQQGLPSQRSTGYEIFDETNLGMSEFVQKLNFRRALEGELSRTVSSLEEVDEARVHIVVPEPALFREKEEAATASITLKLRGNINRGQITGISHLIASSVEGLESENVTVIDSRGNILTDLQSSDPMLSMSNSQLQLKSQVETDLRVKLETMLSQLLGPDRSIVRVAVDLDFTQSSTTSELYDPERVAIRSEEINEITNNSSDPQMVNAVDPTQPPPASTENQIETNNITNYEISKTLTQETSQTGGVERVSVSVLIDGTYQNIANESGGQERTYVERTPDEMDKIELAVRGALGVDDSRGDVITVLNIPFEQPEAYEPTTNIMSWLTDNWAMLLRSLLIGAAVIGILMYVRNLVAASSHAAREVWERKMAALPGGATPMAALPGAIGDGGEALALPDLDSELPQEVLEANQLQQRLVEFVEDKPKVTARLLKTWLVDG
ncbi:flagellar M-ring protein [bacterium BMS3Bbin04]|nr:flagellar M-ring protein [bacterium BMS3Bbin04]